MHRHRRLAMIVAAIVPAAVLAACTSSGSTQTPTGSDPATAAATSPTTSSTPLPTTLPSSASPGRSTADWPMYHGTADRSGVSASMPAVSGTPRVVARYRLDGPAYASPVVVGGHTFVATENDSVYAFDAGYHQLWRKNFGTPSAAHERPCGNIDPLGITGTPIAAGGLLYFVAEHGGSVRHELIAVDQRTGVTKWRRSVDLPGANPQVMQQRGALAISGGRVWVPYGALAGDCGDYKGRVVGVKLDGTGSLTKFDPSPNPQGGIWNPAGGTVDARGHLLFVSANGSSGPGDTYDHTNSVDEIDATGNRVDSFAPSDWAQNNRDDVGLGSQGVALIGTKWAVLGGKSGPVYVLRQGDLGGIGGEVSQRDICKSFGGAAVQGDVVYLPCIDGVRAVRVDAAGKMQVLWHTDENTAGSPVIGGGRVWALDQSNGVLHALDPSTGKSVGQAGVGETSRFATPAISGRDVIVPTMGGVAVVRTS